MRRSVKRACFGHLRAFLKPSPTKSAAPGEPHYRGAPLIISETMSANKRGPNHPIKYRRNFISASTFRRSRDSSADLISLLNQSGRVQTRRKWGPRKSRVARKANSPAAYDKGGARGGRSRSAPGWMGLENFNFSRVRPGPFFFRARSRT